MAEAPDPMRVAPLRPEDVSFAAALHRRVLPGGFFGRLGSRFLQVYYATFVDSPYAVALLLRVGRRPAGVLVGTLANTRHWAWVVRAYGVRLLAAGVWALLARPGEAAFFLRTRVGRYLRAAGRFLRRSPRATRPEDAAPGGPVAVLTHVAVAPGAHGVGAGRALVEEFVAEAQAAGAERAQLVTPSGRAGAGGFYRRLGWRHVTDRCDHDGHVVSLFQLWLRGPG